MKKSFFFLIAINCFFISFSQVAHPSKYIKISGGKVGFGGVAFQNYSYESRAELMQYTSVFSRRMSELRFENSFLAGYTISLGYDFYLIKDKLLLGARYDLANYNNGDYNSMLGGKVGFAF